MGLISIYAPTDPSERASFFFSLVNFISNWDCSDFVVFGDFNSVLHGEDRWGNNGCGHASEELVEFSKSLGLQDMPLFGVSIHLL